MAETVRVVLPFRGSISVQELYDAIRPGGWASRQATLTVARDGGRVDGPWQWTWARPGEWDPADAPDAAVRFGWAEPTTGMWLLVGTAPGQPPP
jgi:hypothetical protein